MIEIKHKTATFRVLTENAQKTYNLLALIDKSAGKRGIKHKPERPEDQHEREMTKWYYPNFAPGMSTMEYIRQYEYDNIHRHLTVWQYDCADRAAATLDPSIPECVHEIVGDWMTTTQIQTTKGAKNE